MGDAAVSYTGDGNVAIISLDRAARMNRLDAELVEGLHQAWKRFMVSDEHRVAVLTGAGEKAFSAGADLKAVPHDLYRAIPGIGVPVDKPLSTASFARLLKGASDD